MGYTGFVRQKVIILLQLFVLQVKRLTKTIMW